MELLSYWLLLLTTIVVVDFRVSAALEDLTIHPEKCKGEGWILFKESQKCFKLIKQFVSQEEAKILCRSEDIRLPETYPPSLATIKSEAEQLFVTQYLFNISKVTHGVWFGGERKKPDVDSSSDEVEDNNNGYRWSDGSEMKYQHWTSGSPTNEALKGCAELSSRLSHKDVNDGEWIDVACEKPNWVLCENGHDWSNGDMQHAFLQLFKNLELTNSKLQQMEKRLLAAETNFNTRNEYSVPIGFVYVQFPGQEEPQQIWPKFSWVDISNSSTLAGNFIRIIGKNSESFGSVQEENCPRIKQVRESVIGRYIGKPEIIFKYSSSTGSTEWLRTGRSHSGAQIGISFETTGGEVRPQNFAVRIWKRIG